MVLKGNPVSPGIACGRAYLYDAFSCAVQESYIQKDETAETIQKVNAAIEGTRCELEQLISSFAPEAADKAKIFSAHREILDDEEIINEIHDSIRNEKKSADFAVGSVFNEFIGILAKAKDPLIAARTADLNDVRERLLCTLQGKKKKSLSSLPENAIVVTHDLLPSDTATIDRKHIAGIITETGGSTSHSAIIARGYGIPALTGVVDAVKDIPDGERLILDAVLGEVTVAPSDNILDQGRKKAADYAEQQKKMQKFLNKPAVTANGRRVEIGLNIGSDKFDVPHEYYDYVGLFRTEFLYMESNHLPTEGEQFEAYKRVLENAGGKTVTLRTLDIGGDKTLSYFQLPKEDNPYLGKRALRLCLDNPEIFSTQLRAALRASAFGPLQIMFPMVGSIDDFRRAKAAVAEAKEQLRAEKLAFDESIKLGVMIEIPSIAVVADLAAREVDFASVGTNDLTQYLCAADRMNPSVSEYYQGLSPAMLRMLGFVFEQFNARNKPVSVCGELAGDPAAAVLMLGLGLHKLSMSEANIARVKAAISNVTMEQAGLLGTACKSLLTQEEVKAYLNNNI